MIERFNILSVIRDRSSQASFHLASERHVRIEFRNMDPDQSIGPFTYEGDVILTCYRGRFRIDADTTTQLDEFDQAVVPSGKRIKVVCEASGTLQLIWSPPYAATNQS